jgi:thymidylate synthase (FAD)
MKIVEQGHKIINFDEDALKKIEEAGRTCYKSENEITTVSAGKFVEHITKLGHHSVIEHANATVRFITNRGVTHELVRHRLAAYSQESTRYVNYGGKEIEFIKPVWLDFKESMYRDDSPEGFWRKAMENSELSYNLLLKAGWRPEQAREVLPNSLKTEIVMTANFREWMHVFKLRCNKKSHPQMVALMRPCYEEFLSKFKWVFQYVSF